MFFLFVQQTEKIAVVEIEGKKSGDLFGFFETSPHFHFSYGGMLESFVIVVICLIGWILDLPVQLVNAFLDFRHGVAPCLIIQLYRFFAANGTDSGIFPVGGTIQNITTPGKAFQKIIQIAADYIGWVPPVFSKIKTAGRFSIGVFDHRQTVFSA